MDNHKCDTTNCVVKNMENVTIDKLLHHFVRVQSVEEGMLALQYLLSIIDFRQAIVFVRNTVRCVNLAQLLRDAGYSDVISIHKLTPAHMRLRKLARFVSGSADSILVTSCCNHGFECKSVDIIINFDELSSPVIPRYVHRLCSRKSRKGLVINFIQKEKYLKVLKKVQNAYQVKVSPLPSALAVASYLNAEASSGSHSE